MSLDERLRTELHAIEPGPLREDEALDSVLRTHDHELVRGSVIRQALAVAVVVSLFASVAMVVAWRNTQERTGAAAAAASDGYRSTATIRIARAANSASPSTTIDPALKPSDPRALALAPSIRRAALVAAHLSPDDIRFLASLSRSRDLLSLTVTAPTRYASTAVTRRWASAFVRARREEAIEQLRARNDALNRRITALHRRLDAIDAELVRIDPQAFKHPSGYFGYGPHPNATPLLPHGPESVSVHELNLENERIQLLATLADLGAQAATTRINSVAPTPFATVISQTPAVRVHTSSPSRTAPVLVGWAIGLLVVLAVAVFAYRRGTRSTRQVAA